MPDSQVIEILGRNRLVAELFAAGIEVAYPARDRGVDLIAYLERKEDIENFVAVPLQVKASSNKNFSISRKYSKTANLLIAYVWGIQEGKVAETYAMTYEEAVEIGSKMGWLAMDSWTRDGFVQTGKPTPKLLALLTPYKMAEELWKSKLEK